MYQMQRHGENLGEIMNDRAAWLAERRRGMGGTDAAGALGVSKWKTELSIFLDKRDEAPPEGTRLGGFATQNPAGAARFLNDANLGKVEKLQAIADAHGHTLLDLAFGWLLSRPLVGCVIAGATRPEQVEANVAAAAWRPSAEIARQIDAVTGPAVG